MASVVLQPLLLFAFVSLSLSVAPANKPKIAELLQNAYDVLVPCSGDAAKDPHKFKPILDCINTQIGAKKLATKMPQQLFEVFIEATLERFERLKKGDLTAFWNNVKTKAEETKAKIEEAIDLMPKESVNFDGNDIMAEYAWLKANGAKINDLADRRFKQIPGTGRLGGDTADGIVVRVRDTKGTTEEEQKKQNLVLKLTVSPFSNKAESMEHQIHAALEGAELKANDDFIPRTTIMGRTPVGEQYIFHFIVMERIGDTLRDWAKLKEGHKFAPTKDEILRVIARTYAILSAIHEAGYRHGDCHAGNWALSRTNQKVVFLFDFSRSHAMKGPLEQGWGDFMWMARDWYYWTDMVDELAEAPKFKKEAETKKRLNEMATAMRMQLSTVLWKHPDHRTDNAPYMDTKAPTHPAAMAMKVFEEVHKLANGFLSTVQGGLKSPTKLYAWEPEPDTHT